jgi:hypothetical protein
MAAENDRVMPGSVEAIRAGCICPQIDNHFGRGYGGDGEKYGWIRNFDCPIHGIRKENEQ